MPASQLPHPYLRLATNSIFGPECRIYLLWATYTQFWCTCCLAIRAGHLCNHYFSVLHHRPLWTVQSLFISKKFDAPSEGIISFQPSTERHPFLSSDLGGLAPLSPFVKHSFPFSLSISTHVLFCLPCRLPQACRPPVAPLSSFCRLFVAKKHLVALLLLSCRSSVALLSLSPVASLLPLCRR